MKTQHNYKKSQDNRIKSTKYSHGRGVFCVLLCLCLILSGSFLFVCVSSTQCSAGFDGRS